MPLASLAEVSALLAEPSRSWAALPLRADLCFRLSASADERNTGWRFYFKLYCFLDTDGVPRDSVEFAFMFEQVP